MDSIWILDTKKWYPRISGPNLLSYLNVDNIDLDSDQIGISFNSFL